MDYKNKYNKYKNKYNKLKYKNNIHNLIGGICDKNKKFSYDDINSVLEYVKNRYECTDNKKTKNKYFVILYGPPASGKTISRNIACTLIKKYYGESESIDNILKSFIDTGVDEIVYDTYYKEDPLKSVKEKLKDTLDNFFLQKSIDNQNKLEYLQNHIYDSDLQKVVTDNTNIYLDYRKNKNIDEISTLLGVFATYINQNVFFEIASPHIDYINNLISTIYYKNYKILFIYPYTDNLDLLKRRNYLRVHDESRLINPSELEKKLALCYESYMNLVINEKNPQSMINIHKNILFFRYNTDLSIDLYMKIFRKHSYDEIEEELKPFIYDLILEKKK